MSAAAAAASEGLKAAGFGDAAVAEWSAAEPGDTADYTSDCQRYSRFWARCSDLVQRLPPKPERSASEAAAAEIVFARGREQRERFLLAHCEDVYDRLTQVRTRFLRL